MARRLRSLQGSDDPPASAARHADHLLGTDELGRDMLARLIYGGRLSLLMGFLPVVLAS